MRNFLSLALVAIVAIGLTACNGTCPFAPGGALGANPDNCGKPVYTAPHCLPKIDLPGVPYPGSPACAPAPAAAAPCPGPVAAAAPSEPHCGPLPANAVPGEVWCCEFVQPPAAAPVDVEVQPARTEWQRVPCGDGSGDCWALVTVPPVVEHRVSAPPPGYYEWRRNTACEVQRVKP